VSAGPFDLKPTATRKNELSAAPRDLKIRAAVDIHPVVRVSGGARGATEDAALFHFGRGRVSLEGIELALDSEEREGALLAIDAAGTDLSLTRCCFRRTGARDGAGRVSFVRIRPAAAANASGDRPPPVVIRETFFDEGQVGLWIQGTADIQLRDCLFGPSRTAIWLDQTDAREPLPARLGLKHVSIIAGDGPVVRINGGEPSVRIDDSVVSPAFDTGAILIATDAPDRLDWYGRGNVYAGITTYLQPLRDAVGSRSIVRFEDWADATAALREVDSLSRETVVWEQADPVRELARKDPTPAFTLAPSDQYVGEPGARRGPSGLLAFTYTAPKTSVKQAKKPVTIANAGTGRANEPVKSADTTPKVISPAAAAPSASQNLAGNNSGNSDTDPMKVVPAPMDRPPGDNASLANAPMDRPAGDNASLAIAPMDRPMPMPMPGERLNPSSKTVAAAEVGNVGENSRENVDTKIAENPNTTIAPKRPDSSQAIRTAEQLVPLIQNSEINGTTLTVAAGAVIDLPVGNLKGKGRLVIRGPEEPGAQRPRLRFRPTADDIKSGASWPALFRVRSGSLEIQGVDIVLREYDAPASGHWAAFGVFAGADLNLVSCSVTLEGSFPRSAVVAVQASDSEVENGVVNSDPSAASIRITDSIVRAGGDLVDVAAGRRLDLTFTNGVVSVAGSFVHGHGFPRGQEAQPVRVSLRQVTARMAGGLVQLESAIGEPELPVADVTVRESILATSNYGAPMLRVDGQDALDGLQDRIRWEGHAVAYHYIDVYRRDQTAQPGNVPRRFDRPSWEVAVGPGDDTPFHGELKFITPWDASRGAWTLTPDDARLQTGSPARNAGADLTRIPEPPRSL
jgi:serine/threonine-protein kinase